MGIGTRKEVKTAEKNLDNVFNYALPQSKKMTAAGEMDVNAGLGTLNDTLQQSNEGFDKATGTVDTALPMWTKILSGDRPAALQAIAPEANSVQAQTDANKREISAMGTARGGGNAGINQQVDDDAMAKIDNLLFGARPAAAQAIGDIGGREAGITSAKAGVGTQVGGVKSQVGLNLLQQALQMLGLGTNATTGSANLALKQQELNANGLLQGIVADVMGGAGDKAMKALGF